MLRQSADKKPEYVEDAGGTVVVVPNGVYVEAVDEGHCESDDFVFVAYSGHRGFLSKQHVRLWTPEEGFLLPILERNWYDFEWTIRARDMRVICTHSHATVACLSAKKCAFLNSHREGHAYIAVDIGRPVSKSQGVQACARQHVTLAYAAANDDGDREKIRRRCQEVIDNFPGVAARDLPGEFMPLRHVWVTDQADGVAHVTRKLVSFTEDELKDLYSDGLIEAIPPAAISDKVEDVLKLRQRDVEHLEEMEALALQLEMHERENPQSSRTHGEYALSSMDHGLGGSLHICLLLRLMLERIRHCSTCYFPKTSDAKDGPPIAASAESLHVSISGSWMRKTAPPPAPSAPAPPLAPAPPPARPLPRTLPPRPPFPPLVQETGCVGQVESDLEWF